MSSFDKIIDDLDGNYVQLPDTMEVLWNRYKLEEAIQKYSGGDYPFPTTFNVHDNMPVFTDKDTGSEYGTLIQDHMFFFAGPMDSGWARDIATGFQGYSANYIGLQQTYIDRTPTSLELVTQEFTPDELAAWMRLFLDWNSPYSFVPRDPMEFLKECGVPDNFR